ncbi:hypothetical protein, partial [Escherichia coli]|uniref:hypothetical protein n=1 Tax=Escherichia coli TaxID=562 RepID=UPI0019D6F946
KLESLPKHHPVKTCLHDLHIILWWQPVNFPAPPVERGHEQSGQKEASHPGWQTCHVPMANKSTLSDIRAYTHNIIFHTSSRILFPVIFRNQLLSACYGYLRTL